MIVYIASSEKHIGIIKEDLLLQEAYSENGFLSRIETLTNIVKIARPNDIVLLKSIWGYHQDYNIFIDQILKLKKNGVELINNFDYIFWNLDKSKYLDEIKFLKVIPTKSLKVSSSRSTVDIANLINSSTSDFGSSNVVIKPSISASGYHTYLYHLDQDNDETLIKLYNNKKIDFIIQPYRSTISDGEISVVIINGSILYAINRYPGIFIEKREPILIQKENLSDSINEQIKLLNNFFHKKFINLPKICRVDFIKHDFDYEVLEVELIDPDLFFRYISKELLDKSLSEFFAA